MNKKICLSILCFWSFLMICMPLQLCAAETEQPPQQDLLSGEITEGTIKTIRFPEVKNTDGLGILHALSEEDVQAAGLRPQKDDLFSDEEWAAIEEAAESLRESMTRRETMIPVEVILSTDNANEKLNAAYTQILECALADTDKGDEGAYLDLQFSSLQSSRGGYISGDELHLEYVYDPTWYTSLEQENQVAAEIDRILEMLEIENTDSLYERAWRIYQYIAQTVDYDYENMNNTQQVLHYTAYGALINKKAVCQGYTVLLYRMLWQAGVENHATTGVGGGGRHVWNIVRMGDLFYNCDVTWDAETDDNNDYFLKSDATFSEDHTRDEDSSSDLYYAAYPMGETDYVDHSGGQRYVFFDANGGSGAPAVIGEVAGVAIQLPEEIPHRTGYDFIGWAMAADAVTAEYEPGDLYEGDQDVILYAVWELNSKPVIEKSLTMMPGNQIGTAEFLEYMAPEMLWYHISLQLQGSAADFVGDSLVADMPGTSVLTLDAEESEAPIYIITIVVPDETEAAVLPEDTLQIEDEAFRLTDLTAVVLPSGCREIGDLSFADDPALTYVYIPDSVETIAENAFSGSPAVTIFCSEGSTAWDFATDHGIGCIDGGRL